MSTTYAKSQTTAQKKDAPSAASVLDASSQSEALQRKADMANNSAQRVEAPRPNNTGMPDNLKAGIESLSGFSMDNVCVHYNSSKPATVQALAYTQGTDIHVAPGQEKHLPHEAWHVAQQMAGRVSPTTNINGMPVNDNAALEHEADVMGEKAVQCKKDDKNVVSKVLQCVRNIIQCNLGGRGGHGGGGYHRRGRGNRGYRRNGGYNRRRSNSSEMLQNGRNESSERPDQVGSVASAAALPIETNVPEVQANEQSVVESASDQNKTTTCSIKVGISYRVDHSGYDHNAFNSTAIEEMFGNAVTVEVVELPKTKKVQKVGKQKICKRTYSTADFADVDMFFIPGNLHALNDQEDGSMEDESSALHSFMADSPSPTYVQENITHKWGMVEGLSGGAKKRFNATNLEYRDRFEYEDKLISYARSHGIPVMAICGGSWQLYHNFKGKTKLLNKTECAKHSQGLKENFAHMVRLEEKDENKSMMLSGIIGESSIAVNSSHWASIKPVDDGYKDELKRLRELGVLNQEELERREKLEEMEELDSMIDISSHEMSEHGSPESFETKYGVPMIGIQWHPETFLPQMPGYSFFITKQKSHDGDELISNSEKIFRFMLGAAIARKRKKDVVKIMGDIKPENIGLKKIEQKNSESKFIESIFSESRFVTRNFNIVDYGSEGNNCLLNSLYAQTFGPDDSKPQEIRKKVIEAESRIPDMADERTTETNFLNPLTLIPVLRTQYGFNQNVWIYDASVCSWMYWANGEEHPSFGVAHPDVLNARIQNDVFLYYVGRNHYRRMSIKSDDERVAS